MGKRGVYRRPSTLACPNCGEPTSLIVCGSLHHNVEDRAIDKDMGIAPCNGRVYAHDETGFEVCDERGS